MVGLGVPEMGIWFENDDMDRKYLIRCEMKKISIFRERSMLIS